jgi:hypothetical protein
LRGAEKQIWDATTCSGSELKEAHWLEREPSTDVRNMTQVEKVQEKELTAMKKCHARLMRSAHHLLKSIDLESFVR